MKHLIPTLLILLSPTCSIAAPFTVLAKSGLNVRKGPSASSEKIGYLPFGTVVEADIQFDRDLDASSGYVYKHFSEVIEGNRGFWMKISHKKTEGYIFSGFGLVGEWVVPSSEINSDFRLLQVGGSCSPINYDPSLHWYALAKNNGKLEVKKTEVTVKLLHSFTEKDTLGDQTLSWLSFPLKISSNLPDTIFLLIGSRKMFPEKEVFSMFLGTRWNYIDEAKFLYPEQTFSTYYNGINYSFRAFETVILTRENPQGYVKKYQIEFGINVYHPNQQIFNISTELGCHTTGQVHVRFKTPQLVWVGDLNSDGLLDFIYYSHSMTESCSVNWEHHLFLSDKNNLVKPIQKVAVEIQGSCI